MATRGMPGGGLFAGATRMPGLLGRFGQALGSAFGGASDPRLTAQQNEQARRQALLMAGLQTITSAQQPGASSLGALAQGLAAGQQAGMQGREMIYGQTAAERLQQALQDPTIVGKLTPQQLAMVRLMPPDQAARVLADIAFAAPEAKVVGSGGALVGADGKVIYENTGAAELPADLRAALWEMGLSPDTMTPEQRSAALARYQEIKRSGATTVNVGEQREFGNLNALATQFRQDIGVAQDVADAYVTVQAAAQNPSPAGDIALIFAFMKMNDPGSTVREGEQATARNAANVPERIRAQYNRLLGTGESLSADQRADFVSRAEQMATARQQQIQPVLGRYQKRAASAGLDPSLIIFDPFSEVGLAPKAPIELPDDPDEAAAIVRGRR